MALKVQYAAQHSKVLCRVRVPFAELSRSEQGHAGVGSRSEQDRAESGRAKQSPEQSKQRQMTLSRVRQKPKSTTLVINRKGPECSQLRKECRQTDLNLSLGGCRIVQGDRVTLSEPNL